MKLEWANSDFFYIVGTPTYININEVVQINTRANAWKWQIIAYTKQGHRLELLDCDSNSEADKIILEFLRNRPKQGGNGTKILLQ